MEGFEIKAFSEGGDSWNKVTTSYRLEFEQTKWIVFGYLLSLHRDEDLGKVLLSKNYKDT